MGVGGTEVKKKNGSKTQVLGKEQIRGSTWEGMKEKKQDGLET